MTLHFDLVDGPAHASEAAGILGAAWPPPALLYTPDYISWQLSFPGDPRAKAAVIASLDGRAVGFAAATPRTVSIGPHREQVAVVSFVAVHPDARGRGVARGLYSRLLEQLRRSETNVVTFAQPDSAGDRLIRECYPHAGFQLIPFGAWHVMASAGRIQPEGYLVRPNDAPCAAPQMADDTWAWSSPEPSLLRHYQRDPRQRRWLELYVGDGIEARIVGAAWAVNVAYLSAAGEHSVPTLELIWLAREHSLGLAALAFAAQRLWTDAPSPVVIASNLSCFSPESLSRSGFRATPTRFAGYLATVTPDCILHRAAGTNLEVI